MKRPGLYFRQQVINKYILIVFRILSIAHKSYYVYFAAPLNPGKK